MTFYTFLTHVTPRITRHPFAFTFGTFVFAETTFFPLIWCLSFSFGTCLKKGFFFVEIHFLSSSVILFFFYRLECNIKQNSAIIIRVEKQCNMKKLFRTTQKSYRKVELIKRYSDGPGLIIIQNLNIQNSYNF